MMNESRLGIPEIFSILVDQRGLIVDCNSHVAQSVNLQRSELVGRNSAIIFGEKVTDIFKKGNFNKIDGNGLCFACVNTRNEQGGCETLNFIFLSLGACTLCLACKRGGQCSDQETKKVVMRKNQSHLGTRIFQCYNDVCSEDEGKYLTVLSDLEAILNIDFSRIDSTSSAWSLRREVTSMLEECCDLVSNLIHSFRHVKGEPVNLRILAGRMGDTGAAISTISKNYELMADEMCGSVERLGEADGATLRRMRLVLEEIKILQISSRMLRLLENQVSKSANTDFDFCLKKLGVTEKLCNLSDRESALFNALISEADTIPAICRQLRRRIKGLDLVKLLCRVENGRMSKTDKGLEGIILRLEAAHASKDKILEELSSISNDISKISFKNLSEERAKIGVNSEEAV